MSEILLNLSRVRERIARAAAKSGRKPEAITLVAVTKTFSLERVRPALQAGLRDIGENRVQEALSKYAGMPLAAATPPLFHLIGPLQSNKAKKAVGFFDVIQSLDRLELARDINRHAEAQGKKQKCLIEVKISSELTKSGLRPELLPEFLSQLLEFPALEIRGLMGIPPLSAVGEASRPYFKTLYKLFESAAANCRIRSIGMERSSFDTLSMGMSSDFETAIEEGSTMVRLGTALFGVRQEG